jgi:hypothetical protein
VSLSKRDSPEAVSCPRSCPETLSAMLPSPVRPIERERKRERERERERRNRDRHNVSRLGNSILRYNSPPNF